MRKILRKYFRVADKFHHCSKCNEVISPGDLYHAEVMVLDKKTLLVYKYHDFCPHDFEIKECEKEESSFEELALSAAA